MNKVYIDNASLKKIQL